MMNKLNLKEFLKQRINEIIKSKSKKEGLKVIFKFINKAMHWITAKIGKYSRW